MASSVMMREITPNNEAEYISYNASTAIFSRLRKARTNSSSDSDILRLGLNSMKIERNYYISNKCFSAWYDERTSGPLSTYLKPFFNPHSL